MKNDNDIYFLETTNNKTIINYNYNKLLIIDNRFKSLKEIDLLNEVNIYSSYTSNNEELLLFCPDNQCMVYVDIEKNSFKIINFSIEFEDLIFSDLYQWEEENVKILTYNGELYNISINEKKIKKIDKMNVKMEYLYKFYNKNKNNVLKIFKNQSIGLLSEISIIINSYSEENKIIYFREKNDYHDVEYEFDNILLINEKFIKFISNNLEKTFYPTENYIFLKAKFLNNLNFIAISSDKSNTTNSKIQIFTIS